MKSMKQKKKQKNKYQYMLEFFSPLERSLSLCYLFFMVGVFPLYVKNQYEAIGDAKYQLFFYSTLFYLGSSFLLYVVKKIIEGREEKENTGKDSYPSRKNKEKAAVADRQVGQKEELAKKVNRWLEEISSIDLAVFAYGFFVLLSFLLSDHKEYALWGANGWEMGLISQMMFVGIYFFLSRQKQWYKVALGIHLIASALTFLLGILHRFQLDPLGMYEGLNLLQMTEFLSTIGQATWFSSYICTVFPLGLLLQYVVKEKKGKYLMGIYYVISFGIVVTQNSDSAFLALAGIMALLALFSCKKIEYWKHFLEIMIYLWGTFVAVGILQRIFWERAIPLNTLSVFFSQSIFSMVMLTVSVIFYLAYKKVKEERVPEVMKVTSLVIKIGTVLAVVLLLGTVLFIYWNTTGVLLSLFGYQSTNNYLYFDGHWGNNRGSSWMIAWQEFRQLPLYQKLFGVGPDAFSAHLYNVPKVQERLQQLWGNLRLTNAHNEYLNSLFCYGIFGLLSWITLLITSIARYGKKAQENPLFMGFVLCIAGYSCHNLFCYQQVCCTPFLFLIMGVAESYGKKAAVWR